MDNTSIEETSKAILNGQFPEDSSDYVEKAVAYFVDRIQSQNEHIAKLNAMLVSRDKRIGELETVNARQSRYIDALRANRDLQQDQGKDFEKGVGVYDKELKRWASIKQDEMNMISGLAEEIKQHSGNEPLIGSTYSLVLENTALRNHLIFYKLQYESTIAANKELLRALDLIMSSSPNQD